MAARGSFQKRQKEAARREKRQMKLDRRQGRQPAAVSPSVTTESEHPANPEATDNNSSTDSDKSDSSSNS